MPVIKFRSVEDIPSLDSEVLTGTIATRAIRDVLATTRALAPAVFPPGVWKYGSLEAAWQERERWLLSARPAHQQRRHDEGD